MPLAALTGPPIITPAPMNTQPQALTNVQIPQLQQAPHHYQVTHFSHSHMHLILWFTIISVENMVHHIGTGTFHV